jgi:hypothetical protein
MLGRGGILPEDVIEPAPGLAAMHDNVKGVVFCEFRGEQVVEAGLGRGGVCFETEVGLGRGVIRTHVQSRVGRRHGGTIVVIPGHASS